jgi:hypothetical protein
MSRSLVIRAAAAMTLFALAGCDALLPTIPPLLRVSALEVVSGDEQLIPIQAASQPIVVRAMDRGGKGVKGVLLRGRAQLGANVFPLLLRDTARTDDQGNASFSVVNAFRSGEIRVSVSVADLEDSTAVAPAISMHRIVGGRPASIAIASGNNQSGAVLSVLRDSIIALVTDQGGNASAGATVTFAVITGGGTLSAATVSSGADGRAGVRWTLGSASGQQTVRASVSGVTTSATFTAIASLTSASIVTSGYVYDGATGAPIPGATIVGRLANGNTVGNSITGANGRWTAVVSQSGTITYTVSANGYVGTTVTQLVQQDDVIEPVPLAPTSSAAGAISGRLLDAVSGTPGIGALFLTQGMSGNGPLIRSTGPDAAGNYAFSGLPAGTYTLSSSPAGGLTNATRTVVVVGATNRTGQSLYAVPISSSLQFVLTWVGATTDLDLHMNGRISITSTSNFWQFSGSRGSCTLACILQVSTTGNGAEVGSVTPLPSNSIRLRVNNVSAAGLTGSAPSSVTLPATMARVDVYSVGNLVRSLFVPSGTGSLWEVADIVPGSGTGPTVVRPLVRITSGPPGPLP